MSHLCLSHITYSLTASHARNTCALRRLNHHRSTFSPVWCSTPGNSPISCSLIVYYSGLMGTGLTMRRSQSSPQSQVIMSRICVAHFLPHRHPRSPCSLYIYRSAGFLLPYLLFAATHHRPLSPACRSAHVFRACLSTSVLDLVCSLYRSEYTREGRVGGSAIPAKHHLPLEDSDPAH